MKAFQSLVSICVASFLASTSQAAFTINLTGLGSMTSPQQAAFNSAKTTWESIITGYKPGVSLTGLTISASINSIDGLGGILGSAGPTAATSQAGTMYTTTGAMEFDSADVANLIANSGFDAVILHEMGHVLGFGTLWTYNGLYIDGTGQYTGANALARYKTEFNQPAATFVPVELGGGGGTADGHWNESDGGGSNTGIVSTLNGKDMKLELMTGWLNTPGTFISETTKYQFMDLGYNVVVPEPTMIAGVVGLMMVARRKR